MKLWLTKNSDVPLREQITRQIMLAVVSGDLLPEQKLPSVREIALRFDVHPNTVSAAYRWLEENGWVVSKRGSGVFVRKPNVETLQRTARDANATLDNLIARFLQKTRELGFSSEQVEKRFAELVSRRKIERIIVVEQDTQLRKILETEIRAAINLPILESDVSATSNHTFERGTAVVSLNESERVLSDVPFVRLRLHSVQDEMRGKPRPRSDELVGVASRWEQFLRWTKTLLIAAGIEAEQIIVRDANLEDWQKGLDSCAFVIADSLTAQELPKNLDVRVFRLISEDSLSELRNLIE